MNISLLEKFSWVAGIVSAVVALIVWIWPTSAPAIPTTVHSEVKEPASGTQIGTTNIQVTGGGTIIISNAPTTPTSPPILERKFPSSDLPDQGPSFDCNKATYRSEKVICSSKELAILDLALANAYRDVAARAVPASKKTLRDSQNYWLRNIREQCADTVCMRSLYEQRIAEFKALLR